MLLQTPPCTSSFHTGLPVFSSRHATPGSFTTNTWSPTITPDPIRCGLLGVRQSRWVSVTSPVPPVRTPIAAPPNPAIPITVPLPTSGEAYVSRSFALSFSSPRQVHSSSPVSGL